MVIILDEMDKLVTRGDETLYKLLRIDSDLTKAKVSVIGITNDLTFSELLDPQVKSLLGVKEMIFPPYNADQLKDILTGRAVMAFNYSALDDEVMPLCVALATKRDGNAKHALDLLRISGEIAERSRSKKVTEEHVRIASEKMEARMVEVVKTLPLQPKILISSVLTLIREKNERSISSGEVYNMYRRLCNYLAQEILSERRLLDLISELDFLGLINAVVVNRGRHGRTKEISLNVPEELIQPVLFADHELKALSNFMVKA
jgi:cell division control protein 6